MNAALPYSDTQHQYRDDPDASGRDSIVRLAHPEPGFIFRGQSIRYWTAGQGEPLLLLHGFPTASWDWHYLWGL
jgi:pimeloyl-ACP methyl ester carboxylesterase